MAVLIVTITVVVLALALGPMTLYFLLFAPWLGLPLLLPPLLLWALWKRSTPHGRRLLIAAACVAGGAVVVLGALLLMMLVVG